MLVGNDFRSCKSIHLRHFHIHDHKVRLQSSRHGNCIFTVIGFTCNFMSCLCQHFSDIKTNKRLIIS